jgi:hypothetical protein
MRIFTAGVRLETVGLRTISTRRSSLKKFLVIAAAMVCLVMGLPIAQAQDLGISGKWHFVLATPGGDREVDADFTVDTDGNVTGKWGNSDVAGTYKDGKLALDFQFTSEEVGATAAMKIDGKLDETAALGGDWAFSEYNGTYKATRPAEAAPVATPVSAPVPDEKPTAPADPH